MMNIIIVQDAMFCFFM